MSDGDMHEQECNIFMRDHACKWYTFFFAAFRAILRAFREILRPFRATPPGIFWAFQPITP